MKKEAFAIKPYRTLIISSVFLFALLIALSPLNLFLEELASPLILPFYYLTRLLGYSVHFIFSGVLYAHLKERRFKDCALLLLFLFSLSFLRHFLSYIITYFGLLSSEFVALFLWRSVLSSLLDSALPLALCLIARAAVLVQKHKCKENFTAESGRITASLAVSVSLFVFLLIMQIIDTVSFVGEQLGIIYGVEIWSIIFDYIFLVVLLIAGFFLCELFTKLFNNDK